MTMELALLTPPITGPIPPPSPSVPPPNGPLVRYLEHPGAANATALHVFGRELGFVAHWFEIGGLVLGTAVLVVVVSAIALRHRGRRVGGDALVFRIALPPEVRPEAARLLWTNLHDLLRPSWKRLWRGQPHLSFELVWNGPALSFQLWAPPSMPRRMIEHALLAAWPSAAISLEPATAIIPPLNQVAGGSLVLGAQEWFSIKTDHAIDPLEAVIASVGDLAPNQGAVVQVLVRPVTGGRMAKLERAAASGRGGRVSSVLLALLDFVTPGTTPKTHDPHRSSDARVVVAKASSIGWEGTVRYGVFDGAAHKAVRAQLKDRAHGLASAFSLYSERNRLRRRRVRQIRTVINNRQLGRAQVLSVGEVAALAHLPVGGVMTGIVRAGARSVSPVPDVATLGKGLGVADTGARRQVALTPSDGRFNVHVLGSTGSGKSTLLTNLVVQDVVAGRGAVVIDPKGDLVDDILDRLPANAKDKVVLFDPREIGRQAAMNVLGGTALPSPAGDDGQVDADLVVDHLVGIFARVFASSWGPRTDDVLRTACLTLLRKPPATLADVPRLLSDAKFRSQYRSVIKSQRELKGFWDWYEALSDTQVAQVTGPVMNKLRAFLLRPFVADIIGARTSSFSMEQVLDGGLLLVRIPKGIVGDETARLLGSFVVAKVWQAATARSGQGKSHRLDAALYVDECQNFLNLPRSFDEILAEARGYGLSLVLAHQHLGQLSSELRNAISSNARNKIFFSMSPEDASSLERHMAPELSAHDLSHLGGYQAAVRLMVNDKARPAFTITTSTPTAPIPGRQEEIRDAARERMVAMREADTQEDTLAGRRRVGRKLGANGESRVGGLDTADPDGEETPAQRPDGLADQDSDMVGDE